MEEYIRNIPQGSSRGMYICNTAYIFQNWRDICITTDMKELSEINFKGGLFVPEEDCIKAWLEMASSNESLDDEIVSIITKHYNGEKINESLLFSELLKSLEGKGDKK